MTDMIYAKDPSMPIRALAENIKAAPKPETELDALQDATGDQAERTFLTMMIEHHQGASEAPPTVIADGEDEAVLDSATGSTTTSAPRSAEMEHLLTQL